MNLKYLANLILIVISYYLLIYNSDSYTYVM